MVGTDICRKEDILFITTPGRINNNHYSTGMLYVSSYLRSRGYDNIILEPKRSNNTSEIFVYQDLNDLMEFIKKNEPKLIGFSVTFFETSEVLKLIGKIKKISNAKFVVGGPHPTSKPNDFIENGVDFVVIGEGEKTAYDLVKYIDAGGDIHQINGLAWKNYGEIIINQPRKYIDNIDDVPIPTYDKIDMAHFTGMNVAIIRGLPLKCATVVASRGCPFNCSFCGCNKVFGRKVRFRSADNVKEEIKLLKGRYGVEAIWFVDDTLTVSPKHVDNICKVMRKLRLKWGCQARVNSINEEMVYKMSKSGCIQLDFGVESGNDRILKDIIHKGTSIRQVKEAFRLCNKYKIRTMANFMIGLPTETKAEMEDTLKLAKELKADFYITTVATPIPGTDLFEMVGETLDIEDYGKMDWDSWKQNDFFNRFNKSEVKDIASLCIKYRNTLFWSSIFKLITCPKDIIKILIEYPDRMKRLTYMGSVMLRILLNIGSRNKYKLLRLFKVPEL